MGWTKLVDAAIFVAMAIELLSAGRFVSIGLLLAVFVVRVVFLFLRHITGPTDSESKSSVVSFVRPPQPGLE